DLAARIDLDGLAALPVFDVRRELALHRGFDAVLADERIRRIPLAAVVLQAVGIDLEDVADDVARGRTLRVDARRALGDLDAVQLHGANLDLRDGLIADVVGDRA